MKLEVSNIIFLISLTILTGYLTFLTTKGGLTNNRQNNIWKKLTLRGKTVFFTLLSMLIILVFQEINSQNSNFNKTYQIKQEQSYRDSIVAVGIRNGIDSSNSKLFRDLSIAFASQNLKIDTLNNTVSILTDSIKTSVINNFESLDPVIWIDKSGIKYDDKISNELSFQFKCSDAGASHIKIRTKLLIELYDKTFNVSEFYLFPDNLKLAKNTKWETSINLSSI